MVCYYVMEKNSDLHRLVCWNNILVCSNFILYVFVSDIGKEYNVTKQNFLMSISS